MNHSRYSLNTAGAKSAILLVGLLLTMGDATVWAQAANTGIVDGGIVGNGNVQTGDGTGVVNNGANNGNINNNQNNLQTGNNTNSVSNMTYLPVQTSGQGGSSALILPRNPLPLSNANLGRSNFGLQFGVQNNPGLGALTGSNNALGWFLQGGLTIPFGKIPDVYANPMNREADQMRLKEMQSERNVFGGIVNKPSSTQQAALARRAVNGQVYRLNAYNYETAASPKLAMASGGLAAGAAAMASAGPSLGKLAEPKVLALSPASIYSHPFNTGDKLGAVEVGREYPYLGHTKSGWVKILMPNGSEGWTKGDLEYLKFDYTQVDEISSHPTADPVIKSASK